MDNVYHIMMAATKNYVVHCIETLHSLKANCTNLNLFAHIVVDCADDEVPFIQQSIKFFDDMPIAIYSSRILNDAFNGKDYVIQPHLTKMTYARCFAHKYLSHSIGRFLWIDSDVLFYSEKASIWLKAPFNSSCCIGVKDASVMNFGAIEQNNTHNINYINCGIASFDLNAMRKHGICDKIEKFLNDLPDWFVKNNICDQTIINFIFKDCIKLIDGSYNIQSIMLGYPQYDAFAVECGYIDQVDMIRNGSTSHMMGAKPWEDRWSTWQAWQVPFKQWQKQLYDINRKSLIDKFGEEYLKLETIS